MDRTACTEPQCLYKGDLYLYLTNLMTFLNRSTDIGQTLLPTEKRLSINNVNSYHSSRITSHAKLRWKAHVKKKREELDLRYKKMYWLTGRNSSLSLHNKLILYKQILKPVWTYGIQLWGCTKQSNIDIIQRFHNKVLRQMVNAPWYIRNNDLHRNLQVDVVSSEIQRFEQKHRGRLHHHENVEAKQLLDNTCIVRRLQRKKPFELV